MKNFQLFIGILNLALYQSAGGENRTLVEQPAFISAELGGSVTIECKVTSQTSSFSVFWTLGSLKLRTHVRFFSPDNRHRQDIGENLACVQSASFIVHGSLLADPRKMNDE
uniref:Ig-like domain-containing protein n=1 Tax=Pyxicephalus adspersus TaxID=30357 RepID=A0AAV3A453_PYXAD|nr:TPA: hypothetical protein GDO54_017303 [Pyxicephalus adspersus]